MTSRKRSVVSRNRRESSRNIFSRSRNKDTTNVDLNSEQETKSFYSDLDSLRINEADFAINNTVQSLHCPHKIRALVKHPISECDRIQIRECYIMKKLPCTTEPFDIELFSSINSRRQNNLKNVLEHETLKVIPSVKISKKLFIEGEKPLVKIIKNNSFEALESWKKTMFERRKLRNSLSNRVQREPESLLMTKSLDVCTMQEDNLLKIGLPYFQSGTGAPLIRSIWPEQEVTRNGLQIFRNKWKPYIPLEVTTVGYANEILSEMNESRKGNNRINEKERILSDSRYQTFWEDHLYKNPEFDDLIIMGKSISNLSGNLSTINETTISTSSEHSQNTSQLTKDNYGPEMIINNQTLFQQQSDIDSQESEHFKDPIQIEFMATTVNRMATKDLNFLNTGSCVIHFCWKKSEVIRYLQSDDDKTVFFFKINDGIILPNSNLKLSVTFKSPFPGFYDEEWELITEPKLSPEKIRFQFHAIAIRPDVMFQQRQMIEEQISNSTKLQVIKEIIDEICCYASSAVEVPEYEENRPEQASEEDTFKKLNEMAIWNHDLVRDLQSFSSQVLDIEWDLSLHTVKRIAYVNDMESNDVSHSLLSDVISLCQYVSSSVVTIDSVTNGLLNSTNDLPTICSVHLSLAIDQSVEWMEKLSNKLQIEQYLFGNTAEPLPSVDVVISVENSGNTSKGKKTVEKRQENKVQLEVQPLPKSISLDEEDIAQRKGIFRNNSQQMIRHIISGMIDKMDRLIK